MSAFQKVEATGRLDQKAEEKQLFMCPCQSDSLASPQRGTFYTFNWNFHYLLTFQGSYCIFLNIEKIHCLHPYISPQSSYNRPSPTKAATLPLWDQFLQASLNYLLRCQNFHRSEPLLLSPLHPAFLLRLYKETLPATSCSGSAFDTSLEHPHFSQSCSLFSDSLWNTARDKSTDVVSQLHLL